MNRRQFLQALASLGASISIPVVLQSASAAQVDEAWAKALEDPWYFEVNDYGTIVDPGVAMPRIRADVFDVWDRPPRDPEHLIGEVESIGPLVSAFQQLAAGEREDLEYELSMLDDFDEEELRAPSLVEGARLERLIAEIADEDDGWKALVRRDGTGGHRSVLGIHRKLAQGADRLGRAGVVPEGLERPGHGARVLPPPGSRCSLRARCSDCRG